MGALKIYLVAGHIPFEIALPISYFLMLHMQAMWCFLKDRQFFIDLMAAFSFVTL